MGTHGEEYFRKKVRPVQRPGGKSSSRWKYNKEVCGLEGGRERERIG